MEPAMMIWPARRVSQFAGLRMQLELEKSRPRSTRSSPPELLSAGVFDFGDTVMMVAREQRPGAKSYFDARMWVKRDARWQMLFSFNTRIE